MQIIPFGNVIEERLKLAEKYKLVTSRGKVWVLTDKCRNSFNSVSFLEYLRGEIEKPEKRNTTGHD